MNTTDADDPTSGNPESGNASDNDSGSDQSGGDRPAEVGTVTAEEWQRLRAPFALKAYDCFPRALIPTPEGEQKESVVDLLLRRAPIRDRLDTVLGPGRYAYDMELASEPRLVRCDLQIGAASRTGLGEGKTLRSAQQIALARAAKGFGIGQTGRAAGPVLAYVQNRYQVPNDTTRRLERRDEPTDWTPE